MRINNSVRCLFIQGANLLVLCLGLIVAVSAQSDKRQLTLEWIFGPKAGALLHCRRRRGSTTARFIILDSRRPANERTFERLDPATGIRQSIVDRAKALANLNTGGIKTDSVPWPISFDGTGQRGTIQFQRRCFCSPIFRREPEATDVHSGRRNFRQFFAERAPHCVCSRERSLRLRSGYESRNAVNARWVGNAAQRNLSWVYWEEVFGRRNRILVGCPIPTESHICSPTIRKSISYFTEFSLSRRE